MKVTEAFDMFIDEQLFRNNSPKTLLWYRENLGAFFCWLGADSTLDDLTIFNYKAYCSYLLHEYEHNGKPLKRVPALIHTFAVSKHFIISAFRKI